ncbi:sulfotransferase [Rhodanobacter sp. Si-c]|uniref:Sulfotransferase n=1 Tax=Rhodanobacter lycopersici TaxID=3162487 RepID=A0ABV3QFC5_9GAMM
MAQAGNPILPLAPAVEQRLRQARAESATGQAVSAYRIMVQAVALAPEHPEVLRWMAITAGNVGDHDRAAESFQHALQALPDDADLHSGLGMALYRLGRHAAAVAHLQRVCDLAPQSPRAWYNLAEALHPQAQTAAAIAALQRALAMDPGFTRARVSLARVQISTGQTETAAANLRTVLDRDPGCVDAWVVLANLKTLAFDAEDVRRLDACMATANLEAGDRARLGFVLARALEDQDDYDRAWAVLQRANATRRQCVRWDSAGEHMRVEAMLQVFRDPMASATEPGLGSEAIFVASLPRSGSTLVEQILASHHEVEGANEITDLASVINGETARRHEAFPLWLQRAQADDWQRLGEAYLARTACWRRGKPRMTDKNLLNWLLAGTALSMLPAAKVVVVRRDPVETCLGCYRQWFHGDEGFSCSLEEMAVVYGDFWRLTRFWLGAFPGRIFDLAYADLVLQPERTIRQLLEFCELPFDPACLAPHQTSRAVLSTPSAAQVRQPIHRGVSRVAHYGSKLDSLRGYLRAAGVPADG